jgi:hypothetical protein
MLLNIRRAAVSAGHEISTIFDWELKRCLNIEVYGFLEIGKCLGVGKFVGNCNIGNLLSCIIFGH